MLFRIEALGKKLDAQAEVLAIPVGDTPTIEEMVEKAKSDDTARALLRNTLAELEFENTEVEFN